MNREPWADGPPDPPARSPVDIARSLNRYAEDIECDFEDIDEPAIQTVIKILKGLSWSFSEVARCRQAD